MHFRPTLRASAVSVLVLTLLLVCTTNVFADHPTVQIQDFAFRPVALTVPVNSTVTFTNHDSAPHTASANDGSFDTGTLKQGQSMTITFTRAGTYAYFCQFHPFMRGTLVVTPTAATGTLSASPAPAASQPQATPPTLPTRMPSTGAGGAAAPLGMLLLGALSVALGCVLRPGRSV